MRSLEHAVALVGHEEIQAEIYRSLSNFVQEGRANRLILMHGPNGSAKSTIAACILRALERKNNYNEGRKLASRKTEKCFSSPSARRVNI